MWDILTPNVLIILAGGSFTLGYLIINQVILRLAILVGSLAYVAYYATVADAPLWGAIYTTVLMMTANLIGLGLLFARRSPRAIPARHRDIYPLFDHVQPGDFRSLIKLAKRYTLTKEKVAARENQPIDKVYFVINGEFHVEKLGRSFKISMSTFLGEAAYLLDRVSATTATFPAGTEVLEWDKATLLKLSKRNPRVKLAFDAAVSKDLANKVALAVAPDS